MFFDLADVVDEEPVEAVEEFECNGLDHAGQRDDIVEFDVVEGWGATPSLSD